jgi:mRNA interferase RelE/StbE
VSFRVRYHPEVKTTDIPRLGATMRERVRRAIESRLMVEPHKYGLPLRKNLRGYWKLRVGDYRVVFTIEGDEVFVLVICHRKDVYGEAERRF